MVISIVIVTQHICYRMVTSTNYHNKHAVTVKWAILGIDQSQATTTQLTTKNYECYSDHNMTDIEIIMAKNWMLSL